MTARIQIDPEDLNINPCHLWSRQWLLLTAGDYESGKFNTMTVGWGYVGQMWGKPSAVAFVRPQRYTADFINNCDSFTLTAFGEEMRDALKLCGAKSGRDCDKIAESHLTVQPSQMVGSPAFAEAELILECRQNYRDVFRKDSFLSGMIPQEIYPTGDFHLIFCGEIVRIEGTEKYLRKL